MHLRSIESPTQLRSLRTFGKKSISSSHEWSAMVHRMCRVVVVVLAAVVADVVADVVAAASATCVSSFHCSTLTIGQ